MAIVDYPGLQEAIQRTLARSDASFVAAFPGFVSQAEERIYNGFSIPGDPLYSPPLRVRAMEHTATLTVTDGVASLPSDYLGMRTVYQSTGTPLSFITPSQFRIAETGTGTPIGYTIEESSLLTYPTGWSGSLSLLYFRKFNNLTSSGDDFTNNLLIAHPMIFEVAVRGEAFGFSRNDNAELKEARRLSGMITAANNTSRAQRYGGRMSITLRSGGMG